MISSRKINLKLILKIGGALSYLRGNKLQILGNTIENADLKPGQNLNFIMVDELTAHDVYIKDVEYVDENDKSAKRCKTLDEYYALPLKKCTLSKYPLLEVQI